MLHAAVPGKGDTTGNGVVAAAVATSGAIKAAVLGYAEAEEEEEAEAEQEVPVVNVNVASTGRGPPVERAKITPRREAVTGTSTDTGRGFG